MLIKMPRRRSRFRRSRRPAHKRKTRYQSKRINKAPLIRSMPATFPSRMAMKFRYDYPTTLSGVGYQSLIFRGNSLFDPYQSGVGAQPVGFDVWASIYKRYLVLGSRIHVTIVNQSSVVTKLAVLPTTNTTALQAIADCAKDSDQRYAKSCIVSNTAGGHDQRTITNYISTAKAFAMPSIAIRADLNDYAPLISANATTQWYWYISAEDLVQSGQTITTTVNISITYYAEMFENYTQTDS